MTPFSIKEAFSFGWTTFKVRPGFFIGVTVIAFVVSAIGDTLSSNSGHGSMEMIGSIVSFLVTTLVGLGLTNVALKAHDSVQSATLHDLWRPAIFWQYLGSTILSGLAVIIGLILVIVPGILAMVMFLFAGTLVVDRALGPVASLKESMRMTKGHRWQLFVLLLAALGINILGAIALLVGLLVTIPVSMLAIMHVYRELSKQGTPVLTAEIPVAAI